KGGGPSPFSDLSRSVAGPQAPNGGPPSHRLWFKRCSGQPHQRRLAAPSKTPDSRPSRGPTALAERRRRSGSQSRDDREPNAKRRKRESAEGGDHALAASPRRFDGLSAGHDPAP